MLQKFMYIYIPIVIGQGHVPYNLVPTVSGFAEVTRDKVNRGTRYSVESEIPCIYRLYGPKLYSYVDRTLLITGVMYFYSKWFASAERVVGRVGVAMGVWLNGQLSEANFTGHLYVGDLAGVRSMEFRSQRYQMY